MASKINPSMRHMTWQKVSSFLFSVLLYSILYFLLHTHAELLCVFTKFPGLVSVTDKESQLLLHIKDHFILKMFFKSTELIFFPS